MGDNVDITPGTGKTVAAHEMSIGGSAVEVQRVQVVVHDVTKGVPYRGELSGKTFGSGLCGVYTLPRRDIQQFSGALNPSNGTAYTTGKAIGNGESGALSISVADVGASVGLAGLSLVDNEKRNADIDLFLVAYPPHLLGVPPLDNVAWDPGFVDLMLIVDVISFVAADYKTFATRSIAHKHFSPLKEISGQAVYAVPIIRSTTTWTTAGNLYLVSQMCPI